MDPASIVMLVEIFENVQSLKECYTTIAASSRNSISILWKPRVCTIRTPTLTDYFRGYLVHGSYSIDMLVKYSKMPKIRWIGVLHTPLSYNG